MELVLAKKTFRQSALWFAGVAACALMLVAAPIVGQWVPYDFGWHRRVDPLTQETLNELERLGLLESASPGAVNALVSFRRVSGKSVAAVFRYSSWAERFGLKSERFRATWYMANPFDLLPAELQDAIRARKIPFRSRTHVWQWCRANRVPSIWRKALYAALIETTPHNLWRASRGLPPYVKNGEFLKPIVEDLGGGRFVIKDGHIATDPTVIPTGSDVLVLLRVQGIDRVVRVTAADIGAAIKGKHVDLPIRVGPDTALLPATRLPKEHIRNPYVKVLRRLKPISPDQRA